ncbi:site-specific integrase [Candidatus Dependentiae bacterium]|nr:site-specific integrase [Candidatus Dependentiae bacterium]
MRPREIKSEKKRKKKSKRPPRKYNIEHRRGRKGEGFYLDFQARGRRVRIFGGKTLRAAKLELGRLRAVKMTEEPELAGGATFEKFAGEFLETYSKVNKRSWRRDVCSVVSLSSSFGRVLLRELTAQEVERFKAQRSAEVSPASVNRELACLKTLLTKAVEWGKLESNPAAQVKKLREAPPRERILAESESKRLINAAAPHLRRILIVLLNTGLRRGELLSLRWSDVDFGQGFIHVGDSKNGKSRNVPINAAAAEVLRELSEKNGPVYVRDMAGDNGESESVFGGVKDVKRSFHSACRRAGVNGLRLHDLRHTFASRLVELGVDLVTVSKLLGHSSITMTMRYAHPTPENMRRAVDGLSAAPSRQVESTSQILPSPSPSKYAS